MKIIKTPTGPLSVNTLIISSEENPQTLVIVDPGGITDTLIECIEEAQPTHIEIMLTHGHFDHIGGLSALMNKYPNTALWIHEKDAHYLGEGAKEVHIKSLSPIGAARYVEEFKDTYPIPTGYLQEGDVINGFLVIHTPGHTNGSVSFWNEKEAVLLSGDTLFFHSYGRTDLLDGNAEKIKESLKKLMKLPEDTIVYPGHGPTTTIKEEQAYN